MATPALRTPTRGGVPKAAPICVMVTPGLLHPRGAPPEGLRLWRSKWSKLFFLVAPPSSPSDFPICVSVTPGLSHPKVCSPDSRRSRCPSLPQGDSDSGESECPMDSPSSPSNRGKVPQGRPHMCLGHSWVSPTQGLRPKGTQTLGVPDIRAFIPSGLPSFPPPDLQGVLKMAPIYVSVTSGHLHRKGCIPKGLRFWGGPDS